MIRDWGHARDYVSALILMADAPEPGDYVIGTGVGRTVAQFCEAAFTRVGLDWRVHVTIDATLSRTGDVSALVADARRAHDRLGWAPTTSFEALLDEMLDAARSALGISGQGQR